MKVFCVTTCLLAAILAGCRDHPRHEGTVVCHVGAYGSGTGGQMDLLRGADQGLNIEYGDPASPDWKLLCRWGLMSHRDDMDVYEFQWKFNPRQDETVHRKRQVSFDGSESVIFFQNGRCVLSIEPGALVLPAATQTAR